MTMNTPEQQTVLNNIGLVGRQIKNFPTTPVSDRQDYFQTGVIALIKAVRGRDPTKGKLSTYAWPAIYREINSQQYQKFNKKLSQYTDSETNSPEGLWEVLPDGLTEIERNCIQMKYDGYSIRDIAKKMEIKCVEVKAVLEAAWQQIKEANHE